jgi:broad specificity phosphatase PhoE
MKIIYVHHGERAINGTKSQTDKLTPLGEKEVTLLADLLKTLTVEAIYMGEFPRYHLTAELINKNLHTELITDKRLNEHSRSVDATLLDFKARTHSFLQDIITKHSNDDIVICITSGGNLNEFLTFFHRGTPTDGFRRIHAITATVVVFEYDKNPNQEKIGEGAASIAYRTSSNKTLLVGKRPDSFATYEKLCENIKVISDKISAVKIPQHVELFSPCPKFPLGACTFDYVHGTPLKEKIATLSTQEKQTIGHNLSEFISQLSAITFNGDKQAEISINSNKLQKALQIIAPHLSNTENEKLNIVAEKYTAFLTNADFCLTHGDLQQENLLLSENNELIGIIDFGNMEYYVSEIEFFPMLDYDKTIFDSMIMYSNKNISVNNIRLVGLVRYVRHFQHVLRRGEKEITEALARIRTHLKLLQM